MNTKHTDAQLERMARELMMLSKSLGCSLHLDVTKYSYGSYGGTLYKIGKTAASFEFEEGDINFEGISENRLHELTDEERYKDDDK